MMTWFANLASGYKWAIYLALALAIVSALGGTVVYLEHSGEAKCELKVAKADAAALDGEIARALKIGDEFIAIGQRLVAQQDAAKQAAAQRQFEVAQVIHDHPLPIACTLDPELVRVRCESIAALYEAAGQPMLGQCPRAPEITRSDPAQRKGR